MSTRPRAYRRYSPDQIARATLIGDLRRMNVPLAVVAEILRAAPEDALAIYQEWWVREERHHSGRRGIGRYVTARLRREGQPPMEITTRTVPRRKARGHRPRACSNPNSSSSSCPDSTHSSAGPSGTPASVT
ncbi:hypothetical protein GCM10025876_20950 [Demequina litorisediminis]|uniref:HTH merR-type domain-containing protein n=1 Tax=Demequina litorisediminis TaxID=1849022 RepID=A0ABQ6IDZ0_9MICO|nr:hypothetical protein GCM10025876_20950 [Demequina litorisediminis]